MGLADWHHVALNRPFVNLTKADIVKIGSKLGVPFERTWSCYKGGELHCGRCGTCVERREAFYLAGIEDPTVYADTAPTIEEMIANDWRID
jgi:7-cyano-7-deazaguanine synthase